MMIVLLLLVTLSFQFVAYAFALGLGHAVGCEDDPAKLKGGAWLTAIMILASFAFWGVLLAVVGGWF